MRGIKKVSTVGMSREDWLEQRRHTIGGSDAAGIIGLSKWSSPVSVWADKTGRLPDKPDTEAMRLGRDLEGYVAAGGWRPPGRRYGGSTPCSTTSSIPSPMLILTGKLLGNGLAWSVRPPPPWT